MPRGEPLQVATCDDFGTLPPDVRALFNTAERTDLQCGADWFDNLARTVFPARGAWQLHVLRRGGTALAALPMLVQSGGAARELRSLGNYYTTLYAPALHPDLRADELAHLLSHLRRQHGPLRSLSFTPLDPAAATTHCLQDALRLAGFLAFHYDSFGNWYLPVTGSGVDYLDSRPGEVRSTLRRMSKKFAAAGGRVNVLDHATPSDIDSFVRVYNSSWKQPEPYPEFIPGLIRLCSKRGWLRLGVAQLNGQTVAAQLWMVTGGKASIYKLAHDLAFKQFSPGSLLTATLMQHVIDRDRVREIDYLSGDDSYKQAWMSHHRQRIGLLAYNPGSFDGLLGAARQSLGQLMRPALTRLRALKADLAPERRSPLAADHPIRNRRCTRSDLDLPW